MKIVLIGHGRFGKLVADIFSGRGLDVFIISSQTNFELLNNQHKGNWSDVSQADVVIPAVPISRFEEIIQKIAPLMKPGSICIDVCSVKMHPVEVMQKLLPIEVNILATHPMFGPDSFRENGGLTGLPIVVCPVRISTERYKKVCDFLQSFQLKVLEMSPEEHDTCAAQSQLYTFLVGRIGIQMDIQSTPIDTHWFSFFLKHKQIVKNDSQKLFEDMIRFNPYASKVVTHFFETTTKMHQSLLKKEVLGMLQEE